MYDFRRQNVHSGGVSAAASVHGGPVLAGVRAPRPAPARRGASRGESKDATKAEGADLVVGQLHDTLDAETWSRPRCGAYKKYRVFSGDKLYIESIKVLSEKPVDDGTLVSPCA